MTDHPPTPYFASLPGRALLAAMGFFLAGPGLGSVVESDGLRVRIFALSMLLGAAASIIAGGWGMFEYGKQTILFILCLPVLLWLTLPGFGVMMEAGWGVGVGVLITGVIFLIAAARPAANAPAGEFMPRG